MDAPTRDMAGFAHLSDHDRSRLAAAPILAKLRVEDLRRIARDRKVSCPARPRKPDLVRALLSTETLDLRAMLEALASGGRSEATRALRRLCDRLGLHHEGLLLEGLVRALLDHAACVALDDDTRVERRACPICETLADRCGPASVGGEHAEEALPFHARRLRVVGLDVDGFVLRPRRSGAPGFLERCPLCGTYYERHTRDVGSGRSQEQVTLNRLGSAKGRAGQESLLDELRAAQARFESGGKSHVEALATRPSRAAVLAAIAYLDRGLAEHLSIGWALPQLVDVLTRHDHSPAGEEASFGARKRSEVSPKSSMFCEVGSSVFGLLECYAKGVSGERDRLLDALSARNRPGGSPEVKHLLETLGGRQAYQRRWRARQGEWRKRLGLDHAPDCTCFTCWRNQN